MWVFLFSCFINMETKKHYWGQSQDILMIKLLNRDTTPIREYNRAYEKLLPVFRRMIINIQQKYFLGYISRFNEDVIMDCIARILINGKPEEINSTVNYFGYVSKIIKYFLYDTYVVPDKYNVKRIKIDSNYDINENEWVINDHSLAPIDEGIDMDDKEVYLKQMNLFFDNHIHDLNKQLFKIRNSNTVREKRILKTEIRFLEVCREYINRFYLMSGISPLGLSEYLAYNMPEIKQYLQLRLSYKYIGVYSDGYEMDRRKNTIEDRRSKRDDFSYFQDDFTPIEKYKSKQYNRHKERFKNNYLYF